MMVGMALAAPHSRMAIRISNRSLGAVRRACRVQNAPLSCPVLVDQNISSGKINQA
jgi:hypothetical protein